MTTPTLTATVSYIATPTLPSNGAVGFIQRIIETPDGIFKNKINNGLIIDKNVFEKMKENGSVIDIRSLNNGEAFEFTPDRTLCIRSNGELAHIKPGTYSNPKVIQTFGNIMQLLKKS